MNQLTMTPNETHVARSTICLNMIVKNEAHVIERCLRSVKPFIHTYCIVDTGSTDNTKDVIRDVLSDIPGEIVDRPWKNFGHNRSEALKLAQNRAEYILVVDADDLIVGAMPQRLIHDMYGLTIDDAGQTYSRHQLFRSGTPLYYKGPVHEHIAWPSDFNPTMANLPGLHYRRYSGGGRSIGVDQREKFLRDARVLEDALKEEPNNARYVYYLGQSYYDAGKQGPDLELWDKAISVFERRAQMGDYIEEVYMSLFRIAELKTHKLLAKGTPTPEALNHCVDRYLRAFECNPARLEPVLEACLLLKDNNRHAKSFALARGLLDKPVPGGFLVDKSVYLWKLKMVCAESAFQMGDKHAARRLYEQLLTSRHLPMNLLEQTQNNLAACAEIGELSFAPQRIEKNLVATGFGPIFDQFRKNIAAGGTELGTMISLFSVTVATRAETVVEIGRYRGASTYALGMALKFLNSGWKESPAAHQRPGIDYRRLEDHFIDRRLFSIEKYPLPEVHEMVNEQELSDIVEFIDQPSNEVDPEFLGVRRIDMLFVDGDHSYEGCLADVRKFLPLVREGGLMVLHDVFGWFDAQGNNGSPVNKVCEELIAEGMEHLLIDTHYMSPMIFRKTSKTIEKPIVQSSGLYKGEKHWSPRPEAIAAVERMIQPGWRVLEIGPGSTPFSKATHFVERPNTSDQFVRRPNTEYLDINFDKLPFADKSFDFVYARHVVEDMFNPDNLLKEIERVGKAGYIETPSALVELSAGVDGGDAKHRGYIHHRWIVWNDGEKLNLIEKATVLEHMGFDFNLELADPMQWNTYFLWNDKLPFKHWQHDIDFQLQRNYRTVLDAAARLGIRETKVFVADVQQGSTEAAAGRKTGMGVHSPTDPRGPRGG